MGLLEVPSMECEGATSKRGRQPLTRPFGLGGALALGVFAVAEAVRAQSVDRLEIVATVSVAPPNPAVWERTPGGYDPLHLSPPYLLPRTTPQPVAISGGKGSYRHYFCLKKTLAEVARPSSDPACVLIADRFTPEAITLTRRMVDFGGVAWHIAVGTQPSIRAEWIPIPAVSAVSLALADEDVDDEYTADIHPRANGLRVRPTGSGAITLRLNNAASVPAPTGATQVLGPLAPGVNTLVVTATANGDSEAWTVTLKRAVLADAALRGVVLATLGKAAHQTLRREDMATLTALSARGAGVTDLAGLDAAPDLGQLDLSGNRLRNLGDLAALTSLTTLQLADNAITDLTPLAALTNLRTLALDGNAVADLSPLAELTALRALTLDGNAVASLWPLTGLSALEELSARGNRIADVDPLAYLRALRTVSLDGNRVAGVGPLGALTSLRELSLADNRVVDVHGLSRLPRLRTLNLERNRVRDIAPLAGLPALKRARLAGNAIADAGPLASGGGVGGGDTVGLRDNPLSVESIGVHLPKARDKGVSVLAGSLVPFFPAAADPAGREGFLRIVNRSDAASEVFINAVDDAGVRAPRLRLGLGAGQAKHFNSGDLERGNPRKGLIGGLGRPTAGDWRLTVSSASDVEALAYARSADGFLTSIHDALGRHGGALRAPIFNPGHNIRQASALRLINPGGADAEVAVWGVDDAGAGDMVRGLVVPAGDAITVTARQLESGRFGGVRRGLGSGVGKWRLALHAPWPLQAVSLLESPTGHLTNLSAGQGHVDAQGRLRLPLFPTATMAMDATTPFREGVVRVVNLGSLDRAVRIQAVDDAGVAAAPVTLELPPGGTRQLNSADVENGNAAKGLSGGVGPPTRGDWRLLLTALPEAGAPEVRAYAYVRTEDGFLTPMHAVAPAADATPPWAGAARVAMFNPASNRRQRSLLRLVNDGDAAVSAAIAGVDDNGVGGEETMRLTVPARQALTFSAADLETGVAPLIGALGDGEGKWRLSVSYDRPLTVMSLLLSPTGHLSNLSSSTRP